MSESAGQDCNSLGKYVAIIVVQDICPFLPTQMPMEGTFQSACRSVAISVCKGYIRNAAEDCGGSIDNVTQEYQFMSKCQDQVDSLIGR